MKKAGLALGRIMVGSRVLWLADDEEQEGDPAESMETSHEISEEEMQAAAARQKASHEAFGQVLRSKVRLTSQRCQ